MSENRIDRDYTKRDSIQRKKGWQRPQVLPEVKLEDGYEPRWVRVGLLGQPDPTNISSKLREGWEPVKAADHPEIFTDSNVDSRFKDNVIVGGLLLCKAPKEMVEERNSYYQGVAAQQTRAVDNNLMRENDPRMPLFNDRKSTVTFGKG